MAHVSEPLTKRAQVFAFGSAGLAILSHKGRGSVPCSRPSLEALRCHEFASPLVGEDTQAR